MRRIALLLPQSASVVYLKQKYILNTHLQTIYEQVSDTLYYQLEAKTST